jgi:hypothetical protein
MQLGSMFISNCNNSLHVSDAICVHPQEHLKTVVTASDSLCGLVVRVSGYRYRDSGFDSRRYQIF